MTIALVIDGVAMSVTDKVAAMCVLLAEHQDAINAKPFGNVRLHFGSDGVDLFAEGKLGKRSWAA